MGYIAKSQTTGSWSPAFTGFSADPVTSVANYIVIGKLCYAYYEPTGNGTSNGTAFTITLPFAAANTGVQRTLIQIVDNNAIATGKIRLAANSNIASVDPSLTSGTWTGSSGKTCRFSIVYEIA